MLINCPYFVLALSRRTSAGKPFNAAAEEQEETGWKYIHGDVFRPPYHLNLFAACVGTGTQILTMAVAIFALALIGVFYPYNRGALLTACVVGCHSIPAVMILSLQEEAVSLHVGF